MAGAGLAHQLYYLTVQRPKEYDKNIKMLKHTINVRGDAAKKALQIAAGIIGQAVMTDPEFRVHYRGIADVQDAVAEGTPALYEVSKETFKPLPNEVSRVDNSGKVKVVNGAHYTTHSISSVYLNNEARDNINTYSKIIDEWKPQFEIMMRNAKAKAKPEVKEKMLFIIYLAEAIDFYLSRIGKGAHQSGIEIINTIYHNDVLIGISVGLLRERDYQTIAQLSSPQALTHKEGGYRGVLPYLESEVVKDLFSRNLIDKASIVKIVPQGASFPAEIDFHEEF